MPEKITRLTGNNQQYTIGMPKLVLVGEYNPVAMDWIFQQTGLNFQPANGVGVMVAYEAQPTFAAQIVKLILTYNFKTKYYNNSVFQNVLFLKHDHHIGYEVNAICFDCCQYNHIHTNGLKPGDYLAC